MTHWRAVVTCVVLLSISLPLASAPTPAVAVAQADQGLNGGWAIDDEGHTEFFHSLSSSLGTMHTAGAGWVRVVFRLGGCYADWTSVGCDQRTALQAYDQVLANIQAHNLRVLGVLTAESWPGSQTDWTANNAETVAGGSGDNAYTLAFAQGAAGILAQHFATQISDWEVWNEPNAWTSTDNQGHFFGSSYLYPSNYAWLLQRVYVAIKSVQPTSTVLFGSLFAHEPFGALTTILVNGHLQRVIKRGDMPGARRPPDLAGAVKLAASVNCASGEPAGADSGASYLCATYSVGLGYVGWTPAGYPFDDVGQHVYVGLGALVSGGTIASYVQDLRQAYVTYEGAATIKRTQVTEVGWPTDQVSPDVQSADLRVAFQTLQSVAYVGRTYWFTTQDVPEGGLYYGLVDSDGVPKFAFGAFQVYANYAAAPRPTAVPTSTPTSTATRTPTLTSTATRTPTLTPTATPRPPTPCSPRPGVLLSVASVSGALQVTVTAGLGALQSVRIGAATNAAIDASGISGSSGNVELSIPPGTTQMHFAVRRVATGQAVTVPLTVTDACGAWPTFVGGGAAAF